MTKPTDRHGSRVFLWLLVGWYLLALGAVIWAALGGRTSAHPGESISLAWAFSSFFVAGVGILARRPGHAIGRLFTGIALYTLTQAAFSSVGEHIMRSGGDDGLYLFGNVAFSWPAVLGTLVVFVPLLFPTGHLVSPAWRWVAWVAGAGMVTMAVGALFQRDVCVSFDSAGACTERLANPIGFAWIENIEEGPVGSFLFAVLVVCMLAAGASAVVRYRRSEGVERAQLRWFTFAIGLFLSYVLVVGVLVEDILDLEAQVVAMIPAWLDPFAIFLALIPVSVGLAISRYRLYDIDRIISRTVTYGAVTAVLVVTYAGAVFLLRRVFPGQGQLAVAASTLAVAALFDPLRRRTQSAVDRRFNRTRYDAGRVVDSFGVRLRSAEGMGGVIDDLVDAASTTVQPSSVSLWLRDG